jgi:hypothetical protein
MHYSRLVIAVGLVLSFSTESADALRIRKRVYIGTTGTQLGEITCSIACPHRGEFLVGGRCEVEKPEGSHPTLMNTGEALPAPPATGQVEPSNIWSCTWSGPTSGTPPTYRCAVSCAKLITP